MKFKDKQPFTSYKLEAERESKDITFTIRLTPKDTEWFTEELKKHIREPKNSTAIKQLAEIGAYFVTHDSKTAKLLQIIRGNYRRTARLGISETEYKIK